MPTAERRVCVTGASGFTGRHLVHHLAESGATVFAASAEEVEGAAEIRSVDITDRPALTQWLVDARPTHIVHLAALSHVVGEALPFYQVNTLGTEALIETAAEIVPDLAKLVIASSANVYGRAEQMPIGEDAPIRPVNHYGLSKMAAELIAMKWFDRLPIIVARPFNYTGRGQEEQFAFAKIVAAFRRRDPVITLGNLDVRRDLSDVRFVSAVYAALLDSDCASMIVNICSGVSVSIGEFIAALTKLTGHSPQITSQRQLVRSDDIYELVGDDRRLQRSIGTIAKPTLENTLRWMLEEDRP